MNDKPRETEPSVDSLISDLKRKDRVVREKARLSLVRIGSPAVGQLVKLLSDPDHKTRWEVAKALAEIGDPKSIPDLIAALEDDDFDIRWLAAEGLIGTGKETLIPLLRSLEQHGDSTWLCEGAHHILKELLKGMPESRDTIQSVLHALNGTTPDVEVPVAASTALMHLEK